MVCVTLIRIVIVSHKSCRRFVENELMGANDKFGSEFIGQRIEIIPVESGLAAAAEVCVYSKDQHNEAVKEKTGAHHGG